MEGNDTAKRIGDEFQLETKYMRGSPPRGAIDWSKKPETYKDHTGVDKISLPKPEVRRSMDLDACLKTRKSVRDFTSEPLAIKDLSYLLWATSGIRAVENGIGFRTAPSAGALYPIETYVVVNRVSGLESGVYHYSVRLHCLEQLKLGDFSKAIAMAALDQEMCALAPVVFIWTAIFGRSKWKYRQRAYRYIYLDAGHMAQNLALAAVAISLGTCQIAALYDDEVNLIIGVDGEEESTVYMSVVGYPR